MNSYILRDVTTSFPGAARPAIDGISLDIPEGEVVAVIGRNGAGKTTLVRSMLGLLRPSSGTISLGGRDVVAHPESIPEIAAFLPQQGFGRALSWLTAEEAVSAMARLRGRDGIGARAEADEWICRLGLARAARTPLQRLSGGQRRLAALASVLAGRRPVLVLDEPTNDLDAEARRLVWDVLAEARAERRVTVVLITHNILEADRVVDRVVLLSEGKLAACEPLAELKGRFKRLTIDLWSREPIPAAMLESLPAAASQPSADGRRCRVTCERERLKTVAEALEGLGRDGVQWAVRTPTLEDVYFQAALPAL